MEVNDFITKGGASVFNADVKLNLTSAGLVIMSNNAQINPGALEASVCIRTCRLVV